jgi:hemerythrin
MTGVSGRFAVGEPSIDRLHEECELVLARLGAVVSAHEDPKLALDDLHAHLERHFAYEESLMTSTAFPPAGCHQREHASVLEVVAEVRRRYAHGDGDPLSRLPEAIVEWFGIHATSMDAALAAWLNTHGSRDDPREERASAPSGSSARMAP